MLTRFRYVVAAIAMYFVVTALTGLARVHVLHRQNPRPPSQSIINDAVFVVIALVVALLLSWVQRLPSNQLGLADPRGYFHLFWGLLSGGLSMLLIVTVLILTHHLHFTGFLLDWSRGLHFGILWAVSFLCIGTYEEFFYRGFFLILLARGIGFWPAAVLLSGLFAAGHKSNPGENWVGLSGVFVFGLLMCVGVRYTNSLWWSIGFHASWNWAQAYLFGTASSGTRILGQLTRAILTGADWLSGGSVGPEGSIFAILSSLPVLVLLIVFFRRKQSDGNLHSIYDGVA